MALSVAVRFKKREDIGLVETGDAPQRGDGRRIWPRSRALRKPTETSGGLCHFGEGKPTTHPKAAKILAGVLGSIGRRGDQPLFLQDMDNGCRI